MDMPGSSSWGDNALVIVVFLAVLASTVLAVWAATTTRLAQPRPEGLTSQLDRSGPRTAGGG